MSIVLLTVLSFLNNSLEKKRRRGVEHHTTETINDTKNGIVKAKEDKLRTHSTMMDNNFKTISSERVIDEDDITDDAAANPVVIVFKTGDKECCHETNERNVKVIGSSGTHDHGSSKVKLKNSVDYKWEMKNYPGHLIAVHIDGKHIAYVINVSNKLSRMEGMVRVANSETGLRALIKGMSGEVLDLQFAHIENERLLASIDMNSLFVHKIDTFDSTIICNLMVKIEDPIANYSPKYDKISWCPYIEIPDEDDEDSQLIVWARGSMFQCFNVNVIMAEHGIGKIQPDVIRAGYLKLQIDSLTISWVALSPDGSTLGVGSTDGVIRFYQVYMHDKEPRCLHQWKPHNGKAISSFFFLDNLTKNVTETYWKYAITAAANNTEFKVWDCGTWECLQTLTITTSNEEKKSSLRFIAEIDRTSSYLVLSCLETRLCYVLQIVNNSVHSSNKTQQDTDIENKIKDTSTSSSGGGSTSSGSGVLKLKRSGTSTPMVYIKSISEFPLSSGILSFSIVDAAVRRYKCNNDSYLCEELDDYDEETNSIFCVVVTMLIVQSKSMQECRILYQPTVSESTDVKSSISNDSIIGGVSGGSSIAGEESGKAKSNSNNDHSSVNNDRQTSNNDEIVIEATETEIVTIVKKEKEKPNPLSAMWDLDGEENACDDGGILAQLTVETTTTTTTSTIAAVTSAAAAVDIAHKLVGSGPASPVVTSGKGSYGQVNLLTPDAFSTSTNDKNTPDSVNSNVMNTILMLAGVAGQSVPVNKPDNATRLNFVNSKIIEDQEHQKMKMKQNAEMQKKFMSIDSSAGRNVADNLASGGSSPSREVQEIMSLRGYDKSTTYSGDELMAEHSVQTVIDGKLETVVQESEQQSTTSANSAQAAQANWQQIHDLHKPTTKHSAELQNAANLISQAVNASSVGNLNNAHIAPNINNCVGAGGGGGAGVPNMNNFVMNSSGIELTDINSKMNQLIDMIKMQSMQIHNLQTDIAEMKKCNSMAAPKTMSEFTYKLEMQLSKLMEAYLKRYENEHKKKLAAFMAGREMQNRELRDSLVQILNQYVLTQFGDVVSKVLTIEIQRMLVPLIVTQIDKLQQHIQMDVTQKLTKFDLMLKDNIAQVCKSKNIIDTFGKSVLVGVQGSLQAAFIESMSSTLIPAYEKSSQNMFKQLHDAFSVGIKEFMDQFDNYLQQLQPMQDSSEEILNKFTGFRQHLDTLLAKHRNTVTETMLETRKDVKSLEIIMSRHIQEAIRTEMRKCFDTQTAALRSQANTPAPTMYDMKETIKNLLIQGQINKAFHQALLANDLNLVEYTLKSVEPTVVFTPDCCLEQKVLLSLIQQISADMSNHNEIKQNYLAEALLAINRQDPITREHAPKVLQELFRNCQMFLMNYPRSAQCSNVRMLMKTVQVFNEQF